MPKPSIYTCLSPALLHLYDLTNSIVIIIDVLRATSTIATALNNGAAAVIPVDNIPECIKISEELGGITAGERDGKIAEGLTYGNSPFEYPTEFINGKTLVLTTTNGTKLLHMALAQNAAEILTGSFPNFGAVCKYLLDKKMNIVLACAAWKDKVNIEDTLFAGSVVDEMKEHFEINCDASHIALNLYNDAKADIFEFIKKNNASHYNRLMGFGLEKDLRYCLTKNGANCLVKYVDSKLVNLS